MVHLPNMSSLTVHGPLLPIGGKSGKSPLKKQKTVVQESSSEGDEPTIHVVKKPKPNDTPSDDDEDLPLRTRKEPPKAAALVSSEDDEEQPIAQRRKGPPKAAALASSEDDEEQPIAQRRKGPPKAAALVSSEEEDAEESRSLASRKKKAEKSPTGRADPKKQKPPLPEPEKVVDEAFEKAMADRVPAPSPNGEEADPDFKHWSPAPPGQVEQKRVPCCSG